MMDMEKSGRRRAAGKRRRAGETLTETLIATLIIGLSSVLFLTMVGASGRIFRKAEDEYEKVYDKITAADAQEGVSPIDGSVTVTVEGAYSPDPVNVEWYGETNYVFSYKAK